MSKTLIPPIKCQGIKSKLVSWISSNIPKDFNGKWIEPFMGSGVVAFNVKPQKALLCDVNLHLINFYKAIQNREITSSLVKEFLQSEGEELRQKGESHFYKIRERFNKTNEPLDFLFLNRSCFNGMIRFNGKGKFNVPFCRKPERFAQAYITKIINQVFWVEDLLANFDYEFKCQSFENTFEEITEKDLIYCDPPYIGRNVDYFNGWKEKQEETLGNLLKNSKSKFILSTWHSNDFRANENLKNNWSEFNILTRKHFYHIGGLEKNRNPMIEALVTNFETEEIVETKKEITQLTFL